MEREFKLYQRKGLSLMRTYEPGEDLSKISISSVDIPELGGMIARNPENPNDQWYVSKKYFEDNLEPFKGVGEKTLCNTDSNGATKNVKDIVFWGNGDTFKLISKASSKNEGWMKSTKAMEIPGVGCVVQVTTQQGNNIAEALTFVPGVKIVKYFQQNTETVVERILIKDVIELNK